jgi:hypothetical protein
VTTALLEGYRTALSSQSSVGRAALHVSAIPNPEFLVETVSCSVGGAPFTRAAFDQGRVKSSTGTVVTLSFVDNNINTETVTGTFRPLCRDLDCRSSRFCPDICFVVHLYRL